MTSRATEDWQLLQEFARDRSEAAFAGLVTRHLDWVYSVALRHVGDPHLAQDVVQSVFVLLAHKARNLRPGTLLTGWLFRTTLHVAAHARRSEQRRKTREAIACTMNPETTASDPDGILWQQLAPHLDLAVAALSELDRAAILLRFYQKASLGAVGERLGISEDAAKKRVSRALEKMRSFLARRGVKPGGTVLATLLAAKTVEAAPATLAASVVKISMTTASVSTVSALPKLAHETIRTWRWAKVMLVAAIAVPSLALLLIAGSSGGWLTKNSVPASVALNSQLGIRVAAKSPVVSAVPVPPVNNRSQATGKTGIISGLVLNQDGHPINGATVRGAFGYQVFAQDVTDQTGQFALDNFVARALQTVTVTADGFAADQQEVELAKLKTPLVFRLGPVSPLKLRVVDESGRGVPGVSPVQCIWWAAQPLGSNFLGEPSDADGRMQWLSPPKGEFQFQLGKKGYRFSRANKLVADGVEHVIVLHPVAMLSGSVTDFENGTPLARFTFRLGHSLPWSSGAAQTSWASPYKVGSDGVYSAVIEEEQDPFLRIEANGYETIEAEIPLTNGIEGRRDFQLRHKIETNLVHGTVLLPNGSPAAGVEVALCRDEGGVTLGGTAFMPGPPGYRKKTDERGFFSFDPKPETHTVVAVGPSGLGRARFFDFSKPVEIRLQAWGRIEGVVRTQDGQWGDRKVKWRPTSWEMLVYNPERTSARSDPTGKFVLELIPPGDGWVATDEGIGTSSVISTPIQVNAGETAEVQVGGVGRMLTGRLTAPPGVEIRSWPDQVRGAYLSIVPPDGPPDTDPVPLPTGLTEDDEVRRRLEFEDSAARRSWRRSQWSYSFKVGDDGSFTIPEVLPGSYSLFVRVAQGSLGSVTQLRVRSSSEPQIGSASLKFVVPDDSQSPGTRIDLGEIAIVPTTKTTR